MYTTYPFEGHLVGWDSQEVRHTDLTREGKLENPKLKEKSPGNTVNVCNLNFLRV